MSGEKRLSDEESVFRGVCEQVDRDHRCECEQCQSTGALCTGSAGSLIQEVASRRLEAIARGRERDELRERVRALEERIKNRDRQWEDALRGISDPPPLTPETAEGWTNTVALHVFAATKGEEKG